ncbi:hypothetical protein O4G76_15855 [Limimaricola sp. G21655-S1]|uniref:hypothetical protein n=1 Tax=Limimaricola sp. G21655-S1 TaxID=3014768 RepID=UPI0022AE727B|nr:hypothetical protein [Limimaricola sp. G21655-S1]MCZ4262315.1 hypothetical protein [Limimaricola sp. G21655-S1]
MIMLPAIIKPNKSTALTRAVAAFKAQRRPVHIGMIIDATGSREHSWEQAQTAQLRMFKDLAGLKALQLRLLEFGGGKLSDYGWQGDALKVAKKMTAVRCRQGLTQFIPALEAFANDKTKTDALILIGDAFEECSNVVLMPTCTLRNRGSRVFCFREGDDPVAASAFNSIAEATGGRSIKLGDQLPLSDLCSGAALLTAGGQDALKRLPNAKARQLLLPPPKP